METDNWQIWCRLCAKNDATNNIEIFLEKYDQDNAKPIGGFSSEKIKNINLAATIEKYFQLKINSEEVPKLLCTGCHSLLMTLENFSERIIKVQEMYKMLQITPTADLDIKALRVKYDLVDMDDDDDNYEFVLFPEQHLYELKPEINELEEKLCAEKSTAANPLELLPHIKKEDLADETQDVHDGSTTKAVEEKLDGDDSDSIHNDDSEDKDFVLNDNSAEDNDSDVDKRKMLKRKRDKRKKGDKKMNSKKVDTKVTDSEASYTCNECQSSLNRYQDYRLHMKRVHKTTLPPPKLRCPQCDSVFDTAYRLKQHAKMHMPLADESRSVSCKYCDKNFPTNTEAKAHVRQEHTNEGYFMCEECGVQLRSRFSLKVHMFQHSGLNPYKCEVCGHGYKEKSKLKNHMEIHEKKKFECKECGRLLNTRRMLQEHLVVHSDVRRFKCDFCGREFKRSKALKVHLIMHTGLKPYVCNFCDRAFSTGSSCRLHKRTIHPEELAAYEAAGGGPPKPNLPNLKALRAITKASNCLRPVGSQQKQQQQREEEGAEKHQALSSSSTHQQNNTPNSLQAFN